MSISKLLEAAALRVSTVKILGEDFLVREPSYADMAEWREAQTADVRSANAKLFQACIVDSDGVAILTDKDALTLASGSARVAGKILKAITSNLDDTDAKNV